MRFCATIEHTADSTAGLLLLRDTAILKIVCVLLQILYTVTALGIADVLGQDGPQTAEELAAKLGEHLYHSLLLPDMSTSPLLLPVFA